MPIDRTPEPSPEERFRAILEEAAPLLAHLGRFCATVEDALGVVDLARGNDGQLRLLMASIKEQVKSR
jgi:hypothetical protein